MRCVPCTIRRAAKHLTFCKCNATPVALRIAPWTGAPREQQALVRLKNRFKGSPFGEPTDDEAKWFLRDRGFEVEEAYSKLATCLRWRKQFGLQNVTFESVKKEAASGKVYLHEFCDVYGRPVLVIRVARHKVGEFSTRESQELCAYFIEEAIAACPPGVENVMGIFDLREFGLQNADFNFVNFLIDAFFLYYPKRAGEVLMMEAPWAFMPPFELMKPMLGKYADLIKFVSKDEARRYFKPTEAPREMS